jgi:uncharacterized protein
VTAHATVGAQEAGRPVRGVAGACAALLVAAIIIGLGPRLAEALLRASGITDPANGEALFTVLVFGALGLAGIAGGWITGCRLVVPDTRAGMMLGIGAATGAGTLALAIVYAGVAGTLRAGTAGSAGAGQLALGSLVVLAQVVAEEVYFRGWVQPMLARDFGNVAAVLATGVAFGLLHAIGGVSGIVALLNMIAGGVLFGVLAVRGGGIAASIGAHGAWNLIEQLGVGLDPNPGVGSFGAVVDWDLVGAVAWGGSADGLNASWAMLLALAAAIATAVLLPWRNDRERAGAMPRREQARRT